MLARLPVLVFSVAIVLWLAHPGTAQEQAAVQLRAQAQSIEEFAARLLAAPTEKTQSELLSGNADLIGQDLAFALIDRGKKARGRGNAKEALRALELALLVSDQAGLPAARASAFSAMAGVQFDQGNYTEALDWDRRVLQLGQTLQDEAPVAQALLNMGAVYQAEGESSLASESFAKSLALAEKIHNDAIVANVLGNIAILHGERGDYVQALSYLKKSLDLAERTGNTKMATAVLLNLGATFSRQGEYRQAEEHYRRALGLAESDGNQPLVAVAWMNLGQVNEFEGDLANALLKYEKGLAICEQVGDKAYLASNLTYIGNLHIARKEYLLAIEFFQKSMGIRETTGSVSAAGPTLTQMAAARNLRGEFAEAMRLSRRAMEIAASGGQREVAWRAHLQAGNAYRGLKDAANAESEFAAAIATIEDLRRNVAGGESVRETFFENKLEPYHRMVDLLLTQGRNPQALEYAERAKARVLLDALKLGRPEMTGAMTSQEIERDREFRNKLASLNAKLVRARRGTEADSGLLASLHSDLERTRLEYAAYEDGLYAEHPNLKLQRAEVEPAGSDDLLRLLPDAETAFAEYVIANDKLYLFLLTDGGMRVFVQPVERTQLAEQVERFRRQLANRDLGFRTTSAHLYSLLLEPAAAILKSKRKLIIVPDGALWEVPFQALITPAQRYLLDDFAISYTQSLNVLKVMTRVKLERGRANHKIQLLGLGNPVLSPQGLPSLPFAESEVRRLRQLYGVNHSRVYVGAEAREGRLKAEAGDAKILHLATHAILDDASPLYSHLLFATEPGDSAEDGFLEAWELMKMNVGAELAVLSACETARGRVGAGEGVIGMSWALFVAGVPTTVLSQWRVESASTSQFMIAFHENLRNGLSEARAIQAAALALRKNQAYQHPFYWAPFIVIGANR